MEALFACKQNLQTKGEEVRYNIKMLYQHINHFKYSHLNNIFGTGRVSPHWAVVPGSL